MITEATTDRPHILIVDDEGLIRWSLRQRLEGAGYRVCEAAGAREALDHFAPGSETVDLVLLDLKLPDGDGLTVLQQIKALAPRCRVVLMTAYWASEAPEEALHHGAMHVIGKPFSVETVQRIVDQLFERQAA